MLAFTDDFGWLDVKLSKAHIPFDYLRMQTHLSFLVRSNLVKEIGEFEKLGVELTVSAEGMLMFKDVVMAFVSKSFSLENFIFFSATFSHNEKLALNDILHRAVLKSVDVLTTVKSPIIVGRDKAVYDWVVSVGDLLAPVLLKSICIFCGLSESMGVEEDFRQRVLFSFQPNVLSSKIVAITPWAEVLPAFLHTFAYLYKLDIVKQLSEVKTVAANCLLLMFQPSMSEALRSHCALFGKALDASFLFDTPVNTSKLLVALAAEVEVKAVHASLLLKVKSLEAQVAKQHSVAAINPPPAAASSSPSAGSAPAPASGVRYHCVQNCKKENKQHFKGSCEYYTCGACHKSAPGHTLTHCALYKCAKCNKAAPGHMDGTCA